MIEPDDYTIAVMTRAELDLAVDWAAAEGWNPGSGDADAFFAADAEGFLIGRKGETPIATISAVRYGEDFAFVGFYIVAPDWRGKGYGIRIWDHALARLKGRTVGLDGVVAQQDNYVRSGFTLAYRQIRYANDCPIIAMPDEPWRVDLSAVPRGLLHAYDRRHFGFARDAFLDRWVAAPGAKGVAALFGGELRGYALARPCREGHKIGPLFADNEDIAESLLLDLSVKIKTGRVFLDVPAVNAAGVRLAERFRFKPAFETARMYRGPAPDLPVGNIYGVTSFELG